MNPEEEYRRITDRIARSTYVILVRDAEGKLTLIADPGLGQPWHSKNKKLADFHAANCGGEARTAEEAFKLLHKEYPMLEKELLTRIRNAAQEQTVKILRGAKDIKPFIDQHGNPTA